jgi:5-methylcytosine-specific restriction endonuclease McrA
MSKNLINKLQESLDSGQLLEIVDKSLAFKQVQIALGYSDKGQYTSIVKRFLLDNDIDVSHFTPNGRPAGTFVIKQCLCCGKDFKTENRASNEQVTCSRACSNTYFRSGKNNGNFVDGASNYRVKAFKHYSPICVRCGFSNILALEVHHKDKNRQNNDLENLEILCANCHTIEHKS